MVLIESSEIPNISQSAQSLANPLIVPSSPLPAKHLVSHLSPSPTEEHLTEIIHHLESSAVTQTHRQPEAIAFSPNPITSNPITSHPTIPSPSTTISAGKNPTNSTNKPTDLTGGDFADPISAASLTSPVPAAIRINAGGQAYTDELGQLWLADEYFSNTPETNSNTAKVNGDISGTQNDVLYQSERYAKNMSYDIPVANGIYDVNLHFAEIFWSDDGKRTFDIELEGERVSNNLDIHTQVGENHALQQGFSSIVVTDGKLNLTLSAIVDHAQLSAIEVINKAPTEGIQTEGIQTEGTENTTPSPELSGIRYITPDGSGDGSSWESGAHISQLDALIEQSAPGEEIWIAGDLGAYDVAGQTIRVDSGGQAGEPIRIRGMASKRGGNDTPLLVGDRAENWEPGKANGQEVFRLLNGAEHLHFSNLDFKNIGNGAFRLGGDLTDITLEEMEANNVRRFVENTASEGAITASVSDLTIRDVEIYGFSKGAIRLKYNTRDVLIEDVFGDSQGQDGDNFAMGVHLSDTVNNVVHRRVTMNNAVQTREADLYWNADGFATEEDTYDITYEDTYAAGNTDSGYDLKSDNTVLNRAAAADNKRNFRIWGSATMLNILSDEPFSRGGIGTEAHIHVLAEGSLEIENGTFTGDRSIDNIIFDIDDQGSLVVRDANITDNLYTLQSVEGGEIQLDGVNVLPPS